MRLGIYFAPPFHEKDENPPWAIVRIMPRKPKESHREYIRRFPHEIKDVDYTETVEIRSWKKGKAKCTPKSSKP